MSDKDWMPLRRLLKQLELPCDDKAAHALRQKIRRLERRTGKKLLSGRPLGCRVSELREVLPYLFVRINGEVEKRIMLNLSAAIKALKPNY